MSRFAAPIAEQIWELKYRFRRDAAAGAGPAEDVTVEDSWRRVARALAMAEPKPRRAAWEAAFHAALEDFKFLPAGRILAGAGSERTVTLFNCFVMGTIPDDMSGIFESLKEAALTMQQGGGIGYDFSTIRPRGAKVAGVGADASGPVSFMDVWDAMCRTIMSAGSRRGAMMATLRCDHPDIEEFVAAKADAMRLRMFNLSVLVTDAFIQAARENADWPLRFGGEVFRVIPARRLWDRIMRSTYEFAEPGVIFIDRINKRNNLWYCETIQATNPCGEQPLPPYGACLLGSINLARLVREPFGPKARLDERALSDLTAVAVRMMDNVVDVSRFPVKRQAEEAKAKRRIGLGVTGLADALLMLGVEYGSEPALALTESWLRTLQRAAYLTSAGLAAEKGAFPLYDRDKYLAGETIRGLDQDIRAAIAEHGVRNALLTSIAPTGTISLYAGNVSSGVEPIFAPSYSRKVLRPDGSRAVEEVVDYALRLYREATEGDPKTPAVPPGFTSAQTLTPEAHVRMQAAAQKYVDSAISKTINLPQDISFAAFEAVYMLAYDSGCKGCATYRPNRVTGSVLSAAPAAEPSGAVADMSDPIDRPESLLGATYKLRWPESAHAIYITMNDIVIDGKRRPFEVFINSKNMEHYAWTVALTRMISAVFRRGGDVAFVVEELKAVFDPRGGAWMEGRYVPSILAAIGGVIERHMVATGFLEPGAVPAGDPTEAGAGRVVPKGEACPACGSANLRHIEGCATCADCGFSRCA